MGKKLTAAYQLLPEKNGNRYSFQCAVTGARFLTRQIYHGDSPQRELLLAWKTEGRGYFNQCQRCGKWVVDAAYNPLVLECVVCAPFEGEVRFCKTCGARASESLRMCPICGASLYYEGVGFCDAKVEK